MQEAAIKFNPCKTRIQVSVKKEQYITTSPLNLVVPLLTISEIKCKFIPCSFLTLTKKLKQLHALKFDRRFLQLFSKS
jgi:hypothetical protein